MRPLKNVLRFRLRGTSLLEAIAAALIFLTVFAAAMELMPRLAIRDDDSVLLAEADYRVSGAFRKYATGNWPCGEYEEQYEWGRIEIRIAAYRDWRDIQSVSVSALIDGSRKRVAIKQLIECLD